MQPLECNAALNVFHLMFQRYNVHVYWRDMRDVVTPELFSFAHFLLLFHFTETDSKNCSPLLFHFQTAKGIHGNIRQLLSLHYM